MKKPKTATKQLKKHNTKASQKQTTKNKNYYKKLTQNRQ
jgi:hypothetical protein